MPAASKSAPKRPARKTAAKPKPASMKKKPVAKKAPVKTTPKPKAPPKMSSAQKTIYNKLKKKGMSDAQAAAFSKNAAERKESVTK